jgi:ribosomal protein L10
VTPDSLSQTRKKGREAKSRLLQEIRDCVDKYSHVFVYSVENMRNSKLKEVRTQWRSSRWFYGRNRVLATALGRSEAEEYREGLSSLAKVPHTHTSSAAVSCPFVLHDAAFLCCLTSMMLMTNASIK